MRHPHTRYIIYFFIATLALMTCCTSKDKGSLPIDDTKWLNTFIDCYGAYKLKQFLQFLENEDWDDDLSHNNIGYTKEGKPVLIDYSSYMEQWIDLSDLDL